MTDKHSPFLWPDRVIGKRESRQIREAHNALVNDYYALLEAARAVIDHADGIYRQWEEDGRPMDTKLHGLAVQMNTKMGDDLRELCND